MIYELEENESEKVLPIFKRLDYNLQIKAVIEKITPGKIYVDDADEPKTAFIWDQASKFYLAGDENNDEFNNALNRLIAEKIFPEALERRVWGFVLHYYPDGWEKQIDVVLEDKLPMKDYRRFYTFKQLKVDWKDGMPSGFGVKRVDEELLLRTDLGNIDRVAGEIDKMWSSVDNFMRNGFGFCMLHGEDVVCWCLSEFNVGETCEIGIETDEEYRRRGLATLTASAFLEHCISNDIAPGWHCWESHTPSIGLAEKIGFEKPLVYPVYFGWFDEFANLLVNGGWSLNRLRRFKEAAEFYERAFKIREADGRHYYDAARAWALAGEADSALRNLNKAVDRGWTDVERMEKDEDLRCLHREKGWNEVTSKLQEKLEEPKK